MCKMGKEHTGILVMGEAAQVLHCKIVLMPLCFEPPPLLFLTAALSRLSVKCGAAPPHNSYTPSYLLQVWGLDCNQILSLLKGGGERFHYGVGIVVLGEFVCTMFSLCGCIMLAAWRKKPGVLEDACVCWELVGESAKGMSLM